MKYPKCLVMGLVLCLNLWGNAGFAENRPPVRITLLQLSDVYEISPVDKGTRAGLARVATLVKRAETQNPNTIFVLAGDTLSPSIASKLFQGKQMIDLWNQLGLDVATLGNHEFDFGNDVLLQRMKESQFTWVNANAIDQETGRPFGNSVAYWIKEVNGVRIGFFGLVTPDTKDASRPGENVRFDDPLESAKHAVEALRRENVDVIVAVTHLPLWQDKQLAQMLPLQLAAILGGHEHTLLQSVAGGTPIYKMGSDARTLGRIELWINPQTRCVESLDFEAIPVTAEIPEDPATAALVKTYEDQINAALGQTLGQTAVMLDARQITNRSEETNLGNFVADVYRQALKADVALINGGGVRSNTTYPAGPITRRELQAIFPFRNQMAKVQVSGLQIRQALEHGVSGQKDEESGRFPQVSGLRFRYDARKPIGSRVVNVTINGRPLNEKKWYTLVSNLYLLSGGDGYTMFQNAKMLTPHDGEPFEIDLLEAAIRREQIISPQTDGRIQRIDAP